MSNSIELTCMSCSTKLLIKNERIVICSNCATEYVVNRGIGVVSLVPLSLKISKVENDYARMAAEMTIKRITAEIRELEGKLDKQKDWIRNRKKAEREWLYGYFAAKRVSSKEGKANVDEDPMQELDRLKESTQAQELVTHFTRLMLRYPNDRRIQGLMAAFGNIEILLRSMEAKRIDLENEKLLLIEI